MPDTLHTLEDYKKWPSGGCVGERLERQVTERTGHIGNTFGYGRTPSMARPLA
jgi:hypothetical protein